MLMGFGSYSIRLVPRAIGSRFFWWGELKLYDLTVVLVKLK